MTNVEWNLQWYDKINKKTNKLLKTKREKILLFGRKSCFVLEFKIIFNLIRAIISRLSCLSYRTA